MPNKTGAYTAVVAGGVILYSAIHNKRIIDTLLMRNTPGSSSGTGAGSSFSPQAPSPKGLVSPFKTGTPLGSTDNGVDVDLLPGDPIYAIGSSTLRRIDPNWYNGQPAMFFEFDDKAAAGHWGWYVAEQIRPSVNVGSHVTAGQSVANYAPSGTGIEIGWAASPTQTEAQYQGINVSGRDSSAPPAGISFKQFLMSVHA